MPEAHRASMPACPGAGVLATRAVGHRRPQTLSTATEFAMPDIPSVPSLWRFPAHPASVSRARQAVAEALPRHLWPHLIDDLGLLTSELVTNAIRYGARPEDEEVVELVLWPADGHYWLAVSDPGTGCADGTLKPRHPGADAEA